jgi:hypothetical protein
MLLAKYAGHHGAIETHAKSFIACNAVPFNYCKRRKTGWLLEDRAYLSGLPQIALWHPPELSHLLTLTDLGALQWSSVLSTWSKFREKFCGVLKPRTCP